MNNEIVNFGHNDLDQLGCMLNIEMGLPKIKKTYFHTNYKDIIEMVDKTILYIEKNQPGLLIISDVSFAEHKQLLHNLVNTANKIKTKVIYLDHHIYPNDFFDEFNFTYVYDKTKSATQITYEFFKNKGKNKKLDIITRLIDIFDIWQLKKPEFKNAITLNDYFWSVILTDNKNIEWLMNEIVNNDYKLPNNFLQRTKEFKIASDQAIEKYYNKKLIHCDGFCTIAFVDEFFNDILYDEFVNKNIEIVIIANSYGVIRFRFNSYGNLSEYVKLQIKKDLNCENIGHLNAFPILIKNSNFNLIINKIKEITNIIEKYKG